MYAWQATYQKSMRIPTNAKFKNSKLCTFDTRRKETKKLSHSQKKHALCVMLSTHKSQTDAASFRPTWPQTANWRETDDDNLRRGGILRPFWRTRSFSLPFSSHSSTDEKEREREIGKWYGGDREGNENVYKGGRERHEWGNRTQNETNSDERIRVGNYCSERCRCYEKKFSSIHHAFFLSFFSACLSI